MKLIVNPLWSRKEEQILNGVAKRVYKFVHPDLATFLAILCSVASFMVYIHIDGDPFNYLWCNLAIFGHYLFDGIDGKIAKFRNLNRRGGWLIDKVSDCLSSCFFVSGFFYATTKNVAFVVFLLVLTMLVHVVYNRYYLKGYDVKLGGTESRIVLIALNSVLWVRQVFMV